MPIVRYCGYYNRRSYLMASNGTLRRNIYFVKWLASGWSSKDQGVSGYECEEARRELEKLTRKDKPIALEKSNYWFKMRESLLIIWNPVYGMGCPPPTTGTRGDPQSPLSRQMILKNSERNTGLPLAMLNWLKKKKNQYPIKSNDKHKDFKGVVLFYAAFKKGINEL